MNAQNYNMWSEYYDPNNKEIEEVNFVLKNYCDIPYPWKDMEILEVGCGTGRFTKRIINQVSHIDAIDPDHDRITILQEYLSTARLEHKCSLYEESYEDFLHNNDYRKKYDLIIFSWSWAYIPEDKQEEVIIGSLKLLNSNGAVISTMVEGGKYEELVCEICSNNNAEYRSGLETNAAANEILRKILLDKSVFVSETMITTAFQFDDYETLKHIVLLSLPDNENVTAQDIDNYFKSKEDVIVKNDDGKYSISDVVRCIVFKRIPNDKKKAKITFNYKLCDNRGDCSAAKECRKYRSAIIRIQDNSQYPKSSKRWGILTDRCDPGLCGKKCETICELFSIYRFWPEVYESLRQIENTAIEPDFFDKDRYGSGSFNPAHRTRIFSNALSCLDKKKPLQILEISDERRHASSFDSVLITDLISKPYYDRYYLKYDIPKMEEESPDRVTLYEDDHKYDDIYKRVLETFEINELPALLFISYGKIIFKYEGLLRSVDVDVVNYLKELITNTLNQVSEEILHV